MGFTVLNATATGRLGSLSVPCTAVYFPPSCNLGGPVARCSGLLDICHMCLISDLIILCLPAGAEARRNLLSQCPHATSAKYTCSANAGDVAPFIVCLNLCPSSTPDPCAPCGNPAVTCSQVLHLTTYAPAMPDIFADCPPCPSKELFSRLDL